VRSIAARIGRRAEVVGEVYEVDAETLAQVDELEEHPHFFRRERVRLEGEGEVFGYVVTSETARGRPRIPSGDWRLG
jgi:gamma-glutamylaminecyclotransferase